jgi:hypothetical protein
MLFSDRAQRPLRVASATALLICVPWAYGMGIAGVPYIAGVRNLGEQRHLNAEGANSAVTSAIETDNSSGALHAQLSYLPEGVSVVALRPWPWESSDGSTGVRLARIEALVWYPLVLLALFGLAGAWRMRRALAFPVLCGAGVLAMYGLTEGNLGTAFRHRGELVWVTLLLATVGIARLAGRRQRSTQRAVPASGVGARQPVAERDVVIDRLR